ncbi:Amylo-alpha-16-glucosidase [Caldalkalibacillus thermarum TA2.A1]|uniref:Amylo-alpha-1,6-glucosidase n=1 Tax=Caldalkalibacillus thermarum (strain TA2.A1) TaxID=986075 RepID=F5L3Y8_CALTT|nr:amylo-alpha-1,6-glucosidase [Caldalkalibacillus thermarum]EGL83950.1 Amylo-alpha-16-glucosidase [Caldalkalibacillus thermarum TA2.A1]QZT35374.1 amylo-alpha-1,6-glucosidase [Caldalkalibacillus thermarum TA2.A1]
MDYRVLKENDLFILTDKEGNIPAKEKTELGLYSQDTRFLSTYQLELEGIDLILLSSRADQNYVGTIRLTNTEVKNGDEIVLWRESLGVQRKRFIYNGVFYERITFENHNNFPLTLRPKLTVGADYNHMFVVRGYLGGKRGELQAPVVTKEGLVLGYQGSDSISRQTVIQVTPSPRFVSDQGELKLEVHVEPEREASINVVISPVVNEQVPELVPFEQALEALEASYGEWRKNSTKAVSDSELFNKVYERSLLDIRALLTDLGEGCFPVAGIPWYAVPFGRDSLITAIQLLSVNPDIAKGTLKTLAKYQGREVNAWRDEQPGKILHEIRFGEPANNHDIPHTPYYGTIDATPLFLVLAAEYYRWTGDRELMKELLPHLKAGIRWINEYGDRDQDGFVEYYQESSKGIANQGWKDSGDSVVHKNGELAKAPIALAEVQGYVYDAKMKLADVMDDLEEHELAAQLRQEAAALKQSFAERFWLEEEQFVAIALDVDKNKVESVTSNPGHCLWSNLLTEEQAAKVVKRLMEPDMFSGYGIRTMSTTSTRYNPMSYHDGSIWPHDNSLIVLGMKQLGYAREAMDVVQALLEAASHFEYHRLPELFCGYAREEEPYPVDYPVACSPQAWAAGTAFVMLQTMLGIQPDVPRGLIRFSPSLPPSINRLKVTDIRVGQGTLDVLLLKDEEGQVTLTVLKNETGLQVVMI